MYCTEASLFFSLISDNIEVYIQPNCHTRQSLLLHTKYVRNIHLELLLTYYFLMSFVVWTLFDIVNQN